MATVVDATTTALNATATAATLRPAGTSAMMRSAQTATRAATAAHALLTDDLGRLRGATTSAGIRATASRTIMIGGSLAGITGAGRERGGLGAGATASRASKAMAPSFGLTVPRQNTLRSTKGVFPVS